MLPTCTVILTHRYVCTYICITKNSNGKVEKVPCRERSNGKVCSLKMGKFFFFFLFLFFIFFSFALHVIGECCRADQPLTAIERHHNEGKKKSDLLLYHSIPFADHRRPSCLALKIERTRLLGFLLEGRTSRAKSQWSG